VWWDRQLIAGAEFSRDIERELEAAKAVVIAWSRHANASPWVKDEAAVARDQSKLVPVSLDREPPPMGFRQYQAIDFSRWKGQAGGPAVDDLLRALKARMSGNEPAPSLTTESPPARRSRNYPLIAAVVVLLGLFAGLTVFKSGTTPEATPEALDSRAAVEDAAEVTASSEPRIAVAAIRVRDDDPELSNLAAALSEDIASGLSRFSYLLVAAQAADDAAVEPRARYVLEGTLRRSGDTLRLTTRLLDRESGEQIWGETFDRAFEPAALLYTQDDLTAHVVASVADPYGASVVSVAASFRTRALTTWVSLASTTSIRTPWRSRDSPF